MRGVMMRCIPKFNYLVGKLMQGEVEVLNCQTGAKPTCTIGHVLGLGSGAKNPRNLQQDPLNGPLNLSIK